MMMAEVNSETPSGKSVTSQGLSSAQPEVLATNPFSFEARTSCEAVEYLAKFRSSRFTIRPKQPNEDIWKRPPPDFRLQVYAPKPPKRNSREAMKPWRYGTISNETQKHKKRDNPILPQLIAKKESDEKAFVTQFHVLDSLEARQEFARTGQHPRDLYQFPKHHDFRGYPPVSATGLPEFHTSYEKDPYNIRFHSERLDIMHELSRDSPPTQKQTNYGRQMAPVLHQPPKWESRLHLPKEEKWPNPYNAYTRYRLPWRSPQEVLMDRVEDLVTSRWSREEGTKMASNKNLLPEKVFSDKDQNTTIISVAES